MGEADIFMSLPRVSFPAIILSFYVLLGASSLRAQGDIAWPEWLEVGGLGDRYHGVYPAQYTAFFFFDPVHGITATNLNGIVHIYYIANKWGYWQSANVPNGVTIIRNIRLIQGKLYGATNADVIVSADSGKTWLFSGLGQINSNDVFADASGNIRGLMEPMKTFARLDTNHCVAFGNGSIFVSTDGGANWRTITTATDPASIGAFADPCQHVYVCPSSWGTAFRSTDYGASWQTVITGSGTGGEYLAGASTTPYITSEAGFFRSTDDGLTWKSLITVNGGPHWPFCVFGPMGEHVVIPWTFVSGGSYLSEPWMTSTGGDDFLHGGANMTDSNGMPLMQQDTFNVPLELASRCQTMLIPAALLSDVDGLSTQVSIADDSLGDFVLLDTSLKVLRKGHDDTVWLAYRPHHASSNVVLRFENHWHCSDWSETRTVHVTTIPFADISSPPVLASNCQTARDAAIFKIDSCQTLVVDSVIIPSSLSSRLSVGVSLPDTVRWGPSDSLFFVFDPHDTVGSLSDSVRIIGHFVGVDSILDDYFYFPHAWGEDTNFGYFSKSILVKMLALPQAALFAKDTAIDLPHLTKCSRSGDTIVSFVNKGCSPDTIIQLSLSGAGYSMPNQPLPIIIAADSTLAIPISFTASDTGSFAGSLDLTIISGDSLKESVSFSSPVGPGTRYIADRDVLALRNFGALYTCETRDTTIWLKNDGCDTLRIDSVKFSSTSFSSGQATPFIVLPSDSIPLTIHLSPDTTGKPASVSGVLTVHSDADTGSTIAIPMTASIIYPANISLQLLSSDSASAGQVVTFTLVLTGDRKDVSAVHFDVTHNNDLLTFDHSTGANLNRDSGSLQNNIGIEHFTIAPLPATDTVGTLTFTTYLTASGETPIIISNVQIGNKTTLEPDCVAATSDSGAIFTYLYRCGEQLLQGYLAGQKIRFDGIYPNPAKDAIDIRLSNLPSRVSNIYVDVYDMLGEHVLRLDPALERGSSATTAHVHASVATLNSGIYIARVSYMSPEGWLQPVGTEKLAIEQ